MLDFQPLILRKLKIAYEKKIKRIGPNDACLRHLLKEVMECRGQNLPTIRIAVLNEKVVKIDPIKKQNFMRIKRFQHMNA